MQLGFSNYVCVENPGIVAHMPSVFCVNVFLFPPLLAAEAKETCPTTVALCDVDGRLGIWASNLSEEQFKKLSSGCDLSNRDQIKNGNEFLTKLMSVRPDFTIGSLIFMLHCYEYNLLVKKLHKALHEKD